MHEGDKELRDAQGYVAEWYQFDNAIVEPCQNQLLEEHARSVSKCSDLSDNDIKSRAERFNCVTMIPKL